MDSSTIIAIVLVCFLGVVVIGALVFVILYFRRRRRTHAVDSKTVSLQKENLLHFIDLNGNVRTIDVVGKSLMNKSSLMMEIALLCGMEESSTLTLAYVKDDGVLYEVDVASLLRRDHITRRLRYTALNPPVLYRVNEDSVVTQTTPHTSLWRVSENPSLKKGADVPTVNPTPTPTHGASAEEVEYRRDAYSPPVRCGRYSTAAMHNHHREKRAPLPIILPHKQHITTSTPISILAVEYIREDDGTVMDERSTCVIEDARDKGLQWGVALPDGSVITIHPSTREVWLGSCRHNLNESVRLRRHKANTVRFTLDGGPNAQRQLYRGAFYLPSGRWCLRVEASDDRVEGQEQSCAVGTNSRVFTVDTPST